MPALSIILPTYNRAYCITGMLDSMRNQTFTDYELIIVDDGSTDNTEEVVRPYLDSNVHFCRLRSNSGVSVARNCGLDIATGEYLGFVDSDDTLAPDYFAWFWHSVKSNQYPEVVYKRGCGPKPYSVKTIPFERRRFIPVGPTVFTLSRKHIVDHGIKFPVGVHNAEDTYFVMLGMFLAPVFITVDFPSWYRVSYKGKDHLSRRPDRFQVTLKLLLRLKRELQDRTHSDPNFFFSGIRSYIREQYKPFCNTTEELEQRVNAFVKLLKEA